MIVSLAKLAQHCVFGNLRGLAARAGEDGPPAMRPWRVANLLNAHRLEALDREGFNIGTSERPGWAVHGIAVIASSGQQKQDAARSDEATDMQHNGRAETCWQSLSGVGLDDEVEVMPLLGGRIQ